MNFDDLTFSFPGLKWVLNMMGELGFTFGFPYFTWLRLLFDSKELSLSLGFSDSFRLVRPQHLLFAFEFWLSSIPFLQVKEEASHMQSQAVLSKDTCFASQWHEKYFKTCLHFAACGGDKCRIGRHTVFEKLYHGLNHSGLWWWEKKTCPKSHSRAGTHIWASWAPASPRHNTFNWHC